MECPWRSGALWVHAHPDRPRWMMAPARAHRGCFVGAAFGSVAPEVGHEERGLAVAQVLVELLRPSSSLRRRRSARRLRVPLRQPSDLHFLHPTKRPTAPRVPFRRCRESSVATTITGTRMRIRMDQRSIPHVMEPGALDERRTGAERSRHQPTSEGLNEIRSPVELDGVDRLLPSSITRPARPATVSAPTGLWQTASCPRFLVLFAALVERLVPRLYCSKQPTSTRMAIGTRSPPAWRPGPVFNENHGSRWALWSHPAAIGARVVMMGPS